MNNRDTVLNHVSFSFVDSDDEDCGKFIFYRIDAIHLRKSSLSFRLMPLGVIDPEVKNPRRHPWSPRVYTRSINWCKVCCWVYRKNLDSSKVSPNVGARCDMQKSGMFRFGNGKNTIVTESKFKVLSRLKNIFLANLIQDFQFSGRKE